MRGQRIFIGLAVLAMAPWAWADIGSTSNGAPLHLGQRVADATLARQRGGTDTASGAVVGNQAINVTTGGNVIAGGALAGASGVPVVVQNTGNNVLIQSSVVVNVQMK